MGNGGPGQRNEKTDGDAFSNTDSDRGWDVQGPATKVVVGNGEEVIHGWKFCGSMGAVEDFFLGTKNEQIFGVELKIVVGYLIEKFAGAKGDFVVAASAEIDKSSKTQFDPAGAKDYVSEEKAKANEEDELIVSLDQEIGKAEMRIVNLKEFAGLDKENATSMKAEIDTINADVKTYKADLGSVKWDGTNYSFTVSGAYRAKADIHHMKASGAVELKGSAFTSAAKGNTIVCAGGKVKFNKHLVSG